MAAALNNHYYPFDHSRPDITLRQFAIPFIPPYHDVPAVAAAIQLLFDRLITVQVRLFAKLTVAAEKVESAIGLQPLPQPADK